MTQQEKIISFVKEMSESRIVSEEAIFMSQMVRTNLDIFNILELNRIRKYLDKFFDSKNGNHAVRHYGIMNGGYSSLSIDQKVDIELFFFAASKYPYVCPDGHEITEKPLMRIITERIAALENLGITISPKHPKYAKKYGTPTTADPGTIGDIALL
jgi:hypothetical protein